MPYDFTPYSKDLSARRPKSKQKVVSKKKQISRTRANCTNCRVRFDMKYPNKRYCEKEPCTDIWIAKNLAAQRKAAAKERKEKWKVDKAVMKEKVKTLSGYKKDLQVPINEIARLIDKGQCCISSNRPDFVPNAGHYHTVKSSPALRFNLHNIHLQSSEQNQHKAGNIVGYNQGLRARYGDAYQMYVEIEIVALHPYLGLTIPELKEHIATARKIARELTKIDKVYSADKRIELRETLNNQIGIYA